MPRYIPLDSQDLAQERALAELEGRDPDAAARAYVRQEHRFYDLILPDFLAMDQNETRIAADPQPVVLSPESNRSEQSKEQRRAYTREWWRQNGREYRRKRKEERYTTRLAHTAA